MGRFLSNAAFVFALAATVAAQQGQPRPQSPCLGSNPYGDNAKAGKYATVNGVRIYYEVYGTGPALLLLHGNSGSIARMSCQITAFSPTHTVIAVDGRARGKSDDGTGPLKFEQQADDFAAVLDHEGVAQTDVLGQSDGAISALLMGIRHPNKIRRIVASAPNLWPGALMPASIEDTRRAVAEADRMIAGGDTSRDRLRRKRQSEQDLYEPHISLESVRTIVAPTLLVGADEDAIQAEHYLAIYRNLQHGQFFIVPGVTHAAIVSSELFNQAVARFLDTPFARPK